jgi:hypothetical protein
MRPAFSAGLALLGVPAVLAALALLAGVPGPELRPAAAESARRDSAPSPELLPVIAPAASEAADGGKLRAMDDRPAGIAPTDGRSGDLGADVQKQIDKLQAKVVKKQAAIAKKQAAASVTQQQLAVAQAALLAALMLPEATPEDLAAKLIAIKQATKLVNKKLKKIQAQMDKLAAMAAALDALQQQIQDLEDGGDGGDGGGSVPASTVDVPLLVQEVLPAGATGFARPAAEAAFGIPFAQGEVPVVDGRPALAVANSSEYQFRTLGTWPDGSVQWALVDAVTDVPAGGLSSSLEVIGGAGQSEGANVATDGGNVITLDTGAVQATVLKAGFNLFDTVKVGGSDVVAPHQSAGILGMDADGLLVVPRPSSLSVVLEENGPARAVVRATGTLASQSGADIVDFTCRITARAHSADLQVDFTVRNANIDRPQEAVLKGLGLVVRMLPGSNAKGILARHDGQQVVPLANGEHAYLKQAYSSASTTDVTGTGTNYKPPIPKLTATTFAEEGYELSVNDADVWPLGDKTKYPAHGWVDLSGDTGGVTLSERLMPFFWPSCLEVYGNGDVVAGLWTTRNVAPYVFCWRQHESRTVSFSFHKGQAVAPSQAALRLDWPVAGRAADYAQYDHAGVFPYHLLTEAQENQAYALMGVQHTVSLHDDAISVTRFLAAHNTGGPNNHDSIERRLGGEWLRDGLGGQFINGLDLALYKSEWQIQRSDNFDDADDPGASNDATVPHSDQYQEDLEHRYRDGMILAYWLTGDERIHDALFDEEEVLAHVDITAQERSFYQTIRALALVGRFTDSTRLRDRLHAELDMMLAPTLDVASGADGFGWQAAPSQGDRRYFVNSSQNTDEKPPGENYVTRGFITASLGPLGYFHALKWLGPDDPDAQLSQQRITDLAFYTRKELFPHFDNPADRHLVYSWAVKTQQVVEWEVSDFHPILLGMAEAYLHTGDASYLAKGIEQIQAFKVHDQGPYNDNLYLLDSRLDVQHFLAVYRDYMLGVPPP